MGNFLNIAEIKSKNVNGYQVKVSFNREELQPFFGVGLLKDALIKRNDLWFKLGTLSSQITRKIISTRQYSDVTNTGYQGIYKRFNMEMRDGRKTSITPVYKISTRNLKTGKATSKMVTIHRFKNEKIALEKAISMRKKNIMAYNSIVIEYNKLVSVEAKKLSKKEVLTLKPHLYKLKTLNQKIWQKALTMSLPNELAAIK